MSLFLFSLLACGTAEKDTDTGAEDTTSNNAETEDTSPPWIPTGSGTAYFLDGLASNSVFTLEMSQVTPPPEAEVYGGYLLGPGVPEVYMGPVVEFNTPFFWQSEINMNALIGGYNRFELRLNNSQEVIYSGQVDPIVEQTYQKLLISSPNTPDGDGSLREIQETIQAIIDHHDTAIATATTIEELAAAAEASTNTILGTQDDIDKDGVVGTVSNYMALIGDNLADTDDLSNLRNRVLDDLAAASSAAHEISPTHPIKDLANYAYDCTQLVAVYVQNTEQEIFPLAYEITTEMAAATVRLQQANTYLGYALEGYDIDEDGSITDETEGTINCTIYHVSKMAYMEVNIDGN